MKLWLPSVEVDLGQCTSMGVGGTGTAYLPSSEEEFRDLLVGLETTGLSPFILGGGYNTVFPDGEFHRPIVLTSKLNQYTFQGTTVRAKAGVRLDGLIRMSVAAGLGGLEMFLGVPGTVGGAVAMNAGGSGHEFGDLVRKLTVIDPATGEIFDLDHDEVRWSYRRASLEGLVVAAAELELEPGDPRELRKRSLDFLKRKAAEQPLNSRSSGCAFKNPPGRSAGYLIDTSGLKGARVGHAVVSQRHANFICNEGGAASTSDILGLVEHVRSTVRERCGVELELEIVMASDSDDNGAGVDGDDTVWGSRESA